jgi:biotin transport system substrate-specific component
MKRSFIISEESITYKIVLTFGFAILTGIASKIRLFFPFTPVPITMQTMVVLTSGYFLGKKYGAYSESIYILFGILGMDWFAYKGGIHTIIGPTGGYLIGFIVASYVVGSFTEKHKSIILSFSVGNIIIYLLGSLWLWGFLGFCDIKYVFEKGIAPFIIGDILKIITATAFVKIYQKVRK